MVDSNEIEIIIMQQVILALMIYITVNKYHSQ
jgi:hypothetical protein